MLSEITLICRPTKDPELKTAKNGVSYVCLDVAVNKGYGEKEHVNYYRGWLKEDSAQRIINAGVKKGSLIYLTGDLDVKTFTRQNGTQGHSLDINVSSWDYVASGKSKEPANTVADTAQSAPMYNNAQQSAPIYAQNPVYSPYSSMQNPPQFGEIDDDEELPF